ncbi:hypothetical protein [Peribacillus sp. ACCC06369]|uniref:hypothetical protein n=1 Tax=Peribacillus sp. ACCC06369 TaxID=3055860 RepID=UPI0025A1C1F6|nr:hypothetical protein [Peribacillus sp. ACCC06369]
MNIKICKLIKGESNLNHKKTKTSVVVLKEHQLSVFLTMSLTRNSTKDPLSKLNPLFENSFKVCSEDLPYKVIYKADSMFLHEFHKQVKQLAEQEKNKKLGRYQELLVQLAGEKSKYEYLMKRSEVG